MNVINVKNWEEFLEQIQKLEEVRVQQKSLSQYLYRGQSDYTWDLLTTLERNGLENISLKKYHNLIYIVKPQIESFTNVNRNILDLNSFDKWLDVNNTSLPHAFGCSPEFQETYSYMVYLRHYGFPSPFLDWTSSPYVAAFFAFRQPPFKCENVSIYVYLESSSDIGLKIGGSNEPDIYKFGPYIKTDQRHFIQQSQYTICITFSENDWRYVSHEKAFTLNKKEQDLLWKFNIPSSERLKVMKYLNSSNLNAFSLFNSEEALMETIALREIHFRELKKII